MLTNKKNSKITSITLSGAEMQAYLSSQKNSGKQNGELQNHSNIEQEEWNSQYNMKEFAKLTSEQSKWLLTNAFMWDATGIPLNEYRLTCAKSSNNKNYCFFSCRAISDYVNHFNGKETIFKANWFIYEDFMTPAKSFEGFCNRLEGSLFNEFLSIFHLENMSFVKVKNYNNIKTEELITVIENLDENKREELIRKLSDSKKRKLPDIIEEENDNSRKIIKK